MKTPLDLIEPELREVDFASLSIPDNVERMNALRASGRSVVPVRYHRGAAYMVLGYDAVAEVFSNEREIPKGPFFAREGGEYFGRVVSSMMGEEHRSHRALFGAPLMPSRMRERVSA